MLSKDKYQHILVGIWIVPHLILNVVVKYVLFGIGIDMAHK